MIGLFYSNRSETLLQRLAENIAQRRTRDGLWETVHVIVPNAQVEAFLRQGLARHLGIAANLRFRFLDGLYRFSLPQQEPPLRLLDRWVFQGVLLACFQDPQCLETFPPLREYLQGETQGPRAVQLAAQLARLFEEYALSRPQWLRVWSQGQRADTQGPADLEEWQSRLWRECRQRLAAAPFQWITLPEYLDPVRGLVERTAFPSVVHVFGLSHVAQTYHQAFQRIGGVTELLLYTLNPCEEFWDDVETDPETRRRRAREAGQLDDIVDEDPFGLNAVQDTRALQLWGRPGREYIRLLNGLSDYDFESDFPTLPGNTLLERIQEEIRQRQGPPEESDAQADESFRILACPGARREAEAVADRIWEAVEAFRDASPPLRFSDIAIIVPASQRSLYGAHLKAAFEAAHHIPLTELDAPAPGLRSLVEAANLLLRLPLSNLDRRSVLEVLNHPAWLEAHPEVDPEAWSRHCENLGIVRGADAAEVESHYLERDSLSWDQGLARLALGAFLPSNVSLDVDGRRAWPGQPFEGAPAFLSMMRSLLADVQRLRGLRTDARTWARELVAFLERHLNSDLESRTRTLQTLLKHFARLEELAPEGMEPGVLDCAGALELALGALERVLADARASLAQGVVLSSYLPMRAIPFRMLILMGLGEGLLPGREPENPLDLRTYRRLPGDVNSVERDRYLFLEMVLCARERLLLSYVDRDATSGESLQASPLLRELHAIAGAHLETGEREALRVAVPLRRHEDSHCRIPAARLETQAAAWGEEWRSLAGPQPRLEDLDASARNILAPVLASAPMPPSRTRDRFAISLVQLRRWLECPMQGAARIRMGVQPEFEDESGVVEDEPLETPRMLRRELQRGTLWDAMEGRVPEACYRSRREALEASSRASLGLLGDEETKRDLALVEGWRASLEGTVEVHRFGDSGEGEPPPRFLHAPLTLDVDGLGLEISGRTEPQWQSGSLLLVERKDAGKRFTVREQRETLKAYLDQLMLTAAGIQEGSHRAWICATGDERCRGLRPLELPALDREGALEILRGWLREILFEAHPWAIPIEAVLEKAEDLETWVAQKLISDQSFSSRHGPIPRPEEHLPPADYDWNAVVRRRLRGFLELFSDKQNLG